MTLMRNTQMNADSFLLFSVISAFSVLLLKNPERLKKAGDSGLESPAFFM